MNKIPFCPVSIECVYESRYSSKVESSCQNKTPDLAILHWTFKAKKNLMLKILSPKLCLQGLNINSY